jgi:putative Mg2+ transporter-C (MgtC) family protein
MTFEADLVIRLLVASVLGAFVGVERELHGHPAGMRTHLLVSLGSGLFTMVSIYSFVGVLDPSIQAPVDPSRVAAQVVSGIGFLGAGAILKDGFRIRGLTTTASLWATAAIGMAAGAGEALLAVAGTAIVIVSLWPLNAVAERLHGAFREEGHIRVVVDSRRSWSRSARGSPTRPCPCGR